MYYAESILLICYNDVNLLVVIVSSKIYFYFLLDGTDLRKIPVQGFGKDIVKEVHAYLVNCPIAILILKALRMIKCRQWHFHKIFVFICVSFWQTLNQYFTCTPDSKVHGANMGPIWGRQDPGGPHVGPMNFAIWEVVTTRHYTTQQH